MEETDCCPRYVDRRGTCCLKYDALTEFFGRSELLPLWIADMDFAAPDEVTDALRRRLEHPVYGYSAVPESYWQSIIDWLAERHAWHVERPELAHVGGIVRGIGLIINFYTRPGDTILIQPPVYHPFRRLIEENGRRCVTNSLVVRDGRLEADLDDLRHLFATEHPKMMILCNPHNPGGRQWDEPTLRTIASLAREYGVIVVSDEIHSDLMLDGKRHIPYLSVGPDAEATGIALGAPSKTFNIPGLASSWIVIKNPELRDGFYKWMETNELSAPTFTVTIATEAAYRHGAPWLDRTLRYIEQNIDAVCAWIETNIPAIRVMRPDASFLLWLDCHGLGLDHDRLVHLFVGDAHLALTDGRIFGQEGDGWMRLNVATDRALLIEALERLKHAIDSRCNCND